MYKKLYVAALLACAACESQARELDEIDASTTKVTGTVDAISASQIVLDNIRRGELFETVTVKTPRLPTGFMDDSLAPQGWIARTDCTTLEPTAGNWSGAPGASASSMSMTTSRRS